MITFNTASREGKFISAEAKQASLVCSNSTKWKTCPAHWLSFWRAEETEEEQSLSSCSTEDTSTYESIEVLTDAFECESMDLKQSYKGLGLSGLKRSSDLDTFAMWHAERMAGAKVLRHSEPFEVVARMDWETRKMGENIGRGQTFQKGYAKMLQKSSNLSNLVDPAYHEFGMATAIGSDGKVYICQIFRG